MKRFYQSVFVEEAGGGFRLRLDERALRTQGGAPQVVPTLALAEALAEEWRVQGERVDPRSFPLRDLTDLAIDQVAPERAATLARLLAFVETDTLCYRAEPDEPLFHRQRAVWEPLVADCEAAHRVRLERVSGIVHRPQPAESLATLRALLERCDPFTLAGLVTLSSLGASLVVALAVLGGGDPAALFAAANLEEDWQAEHWGWEAEAHKVRSVREEAFVTAAQFIRLARAGEGLPPPPSAS